jgi:alpha-beta hydrolase superfamily lysophospholipase/SAM-dependent methyltransferase
MDLWEISEEHFNTFDGTELFYRAWKPKVVSRKALILLHRGHEHSGRVIDLFNDISMEDFWGFAWDARGHGRSPGDRGYAPSFHCLVRDLDCFVKHVSEKYGISIEDISIVANSVGAVIASAWVHDYAPRIRAMVLAAPAFRIKLYIPFAIPMLRLLQCIKGKVFIKSYVKSKFLTHDPTQAEAYDKDELVSRNIAVNILLGLHDISTRIAADAGAIVTPTLILSAGSDWVVKTSPQRKFFEGLSSSSKEFVKYPGFYHAVFYEKGRDKPIRKARDFIVSTYKNSHDRSFLLDADKKGYTMEEYNRISGKTPFLRNLSYGLQKFFMKTLGMLSNGIKLGFETGFDSGKSLDYVYENEARGITPLGRMIDRGYLNAIGWKGIRQRKVHLKETLKKAINAVSDEYSQVRILDIASGPGRYILETIKESGLQNVSVLLRDYKEENIEAGRKIMKEMGIEDVRYELADAFDRKSITAVEPKPNIAIVSGLYELFADNEMVLNSLGGVFDALDEGGYLVYTGQPWHPQLEMIAKTLPNRDGKYWVMRRRTQAEMDELVREAGLKKINTMIDEYGIFTVSIARKDSDGK